MPALPASVWKALAKATRPLKRKKGKKKAKPHLIGESGPPYIVQPGDRFIPNASFNIHIDGQKFAETMFPDFWTVMMKRKKGEDTDGG